MFLIPDKCKPVLFFSAFCASTHDKYNITFEGMVKASLDNSTLDFYGRTAENM